MPLAALGHLIGSDGSGATRDPETGGGYEAIGRESGAARLSTLGAVAVNDGTDAAGNLEGDCTAQTATEISGHGTALRNVAEGRTQHPNAVLSGHWPSECQKTR